MMIFILFLILALAFTGYYCIKFAIILLRLQETIENAIDLLDKKNEQILQILQIPVFYDSKEVKYVLRAIEECSEIITTIEDDLTKDVNIINFIEERVDLNLEKPENRD